MSIDSLALSAITAGLPPDAEYDAVYAAVTATERGRRFLTEYATRNRHADSHLITAARAWMGAAIDAAAQPAAVSVGDLATLAATIDRIGSALEGERARLSDIAAAAERIAQITSELRERAVKTALCDALDAAAREITSGSGEGAANAAKLLRELDADIGALIKAARANEAVQVARGDNGAASGVPASVATAPEAGRTANAGGGSAADSSLQFLPFDSTWQDDGKFAAAAAAPGALSSLGDNGRALHDLQSAEPQGPSVDATPAQSHQALELPSAEPTNRPHSYIEPPAFAYAPPARELRPDPRDDPCDFFDVMPQGAGVPSLAPPAAVIRQSLLRRVTSALKISSTRRQNF